MQIHLAGGVRCGLCGLAFSLAGALPIVAQGGAGQLAAGSVATVAVDANTRRDILAARDAVWRAWFADDTTKLRDLLPEAVAAGSAGEEWADRKSVLDEARQFTSNGGKLVRLEFPRTEIRVAGAVGVVFSTFVFETETNGQRHTSTGRSTEVFVLREGRWQNPFWHLASN
jgi:hypothetical protein